MTITDKSGQIVPAQKRKRTLATELDRLKPEIARALPSALDPERMARIATTALRLTPHLSECTIPSFLGSVLTLAQLGLEPSSGLGHAYLIPRKNKETGNYECTTIIGYEGLLELMYRTGKVALVYANVVREGDEFYYEYGLHRDLRHKPLADDDAPMTHVYAVAELTSGHKAFVVLTKGQVLKRKLSAQGTGSKASPWNQHEDEMWKKSAVRALTKYLPRSAEVSQAAAFDEAPEYGAKQTSFLSPEVRETLEDKGYDMEGDEVPDGEPS